MRAVIVCDFGAVNGGAAQVAIASACALADAGVAVSYVCAMGPVSPLLQRPGIDVHCLGLDSVWRRGNKIAAAAQGIWNGAARRTLEDLLAGMPREETVVHFHQWSKAFSPSVFLAPLRHGLRAVVSLHDYFIACPNGAFYHFGRNAPCALAPLSTACLRSRCDRDGSAHKAVRVLRQVATRYALARAGADLGVVSVSPFADRVVDRFVPAIHARYVLRSPIDAMRKEAVPVARNEDFVFVGRLMEEKGVRRLARIAAAMRLNLLIVGDGPLLEELRHIGGTVRCAGWLAGNDLEAALRRARALVFPSTWYETGGLVVVEALARGIPAIVSRTTAAADDVVDGVSGIVVPPGDDDALRAAMRQLIDDATAARMGAEAHRRYWAAPRTAQTHAAGLLQIYRSVLSQGCADRVAVDVAAA